MELIAKAEHGKRIVNPARFPPSQLFRPTSGKTGTLRATEFTSAKIPCAFVIFGIVRQSSVIEPRPMPDSTSFKCMKDISISPIQLEFERYVCAMAEVYQIRREIYIRPWSNGLSMSNNTFKRTL